MTCAAIDSAGNRSEGNLTVTVFGASEQFTSISELIESFQLSRGTENALQTQLRVAQKHLDGGRQQAACALLATFDRHVQSQASRQLNSDQTAQLRSASRDIQSLIGCS